MLSTYTSFKCKMCRKEFVLLSEDVEVMQGYLVCPYCSSKKVKKEKISDSLKECMKERVYKKINGTIRQVR